MNIFDHINNDFLISDNRFFLYQELKLITCTYQFFFSNKKKYPQNIQTAPDNKLEFGWTVPDVPEVGDEISRGWPSDCRYWAGNQYRENKPKVKLQSGHTILQVIITNNIAFTIGFQSS